MPCRNYFHTTLQAVCAIHSYSAHRVFTNVLLNFHDQNSAVIAFDSQCIMNAWKKQIGVDVFALKVHIDYRSDNL